MKKIQQILCAAAVAAILAGCGNGSKFNVAGTVSDPNFEGAQVYLVRDGEAVDSTVVEGGKFAFSGDAAEPWIASVVALGLDGRAMLDFVAEPGSISLDIITDALGGTPLNDSLTAHRQRSADPALEGELKAWLELYYASDDAAETTSVPVPSGLDYDISGNNIDGFVVTVYKNSTGAVQPATTEAAAVTTEAETTEE